LQERNLKDQVISSYVNAHRAEQKWYITIHKHTHTVYIFRYLECAKSFKLKKIVTSLSMLVK